MVNTTKQFFFISYTVYKSVDDAEIKYENRFQFRFSVNQLQNKWEHMGIFFIQNLKNILI